MMGESAHNDTVTDSDRLTDTVRSHSHTHIQSDYFRVSFREQRTASEPLECYEQRQAREEYRSITFHLFVTLNKSSLCYLCIYYYFRYVFFFVFFYFFFFYFFFFVFFLIYCFIFFIFICNGNCCCSCNISTGTIRCFTSFVFFIYWFTYCFSSFVYICSFEKLATQKS